MNSDGDEDTDFLQPPTPVVESGDKARAINNVPLALTGTMVFTAIVSLVLCIVWVAVVSDYGGFNMSNGTWHFLLMTLFLIFTGIGATAFRVFTFVSRPVAKLIHAGSLLMAFIIATVGLFAIFKFHNDKGIANMYSLHSWLGIVFVVLFGLQAVGGVFSFLFPLIQPATRTMALPYHRAGGTILLAGIAGTAMIGINEKLIFAVKTYSQKTAYGLVPNAFGIVLFTFALIALLILIRPEYKREENRRHY